jgi:hypothetical protein
MRATTPGQFSVLPGQAYPMYNDEVWGRSASDRIRVAPQTIAARPVLAGDFDNSCRVDDFDTRLVAGAYGGDVAAYDVNADGQIDLHDVTAVDGRVGAGCGADRSAPGPGSDRASLSLHAGTTTPHMSDEFDVDVLLDAVEPAGGETTAPVTGYGVTLNFDPGLLQVKKVTLNPSVGAVLPLGPHVDNVQGRVALGGYDLASPAAGVMLATVTFQTRSVGAGIITASAAEAVDESGRAIAATAGDPVPVQVSGEQHFAPFVVR